MQRKRYTYQQLKKQKDILRFKRQSLINECKNNPCSICNNSFLPCAMDLHHIIPAKKKNKAGSNEFMGMSSKTFLNEIKKCILVCSNCHRILHFNAKKNNNFKSHLSELIIKNEKVSSIKNMDTPYLVGLNFDTTTNS